MDTGTGCLICGEELTYTADNQTAKCHFCDKIVESNVKCPDNHYVCDICHSQNAFDFIRSYCCRSNIESPLTMAIEIMKSPKIKMHGPEHHYLVAAVLIAAYCNIKKLDNKTELLNQARERAKKVPGGFCGTHGNCGAGVSTGIFSSIVTDANPLSGMPWKHSNMLTAKSLLSIAEAGGPRCCKRDTFLAITEAINYSKEHFNVHMKTSEEIICDFSDKNRQCLKAICPYFPKTN